MKAVQQNQEVTYHFELELTRTELDAVLDGEPKTLGKLREQLRLARQGFKPDPMKRGRDTGFEVGVPPNPIHLEA